MKIYCCYLMISHGFAWKYPLLIGVTDKLDNIFRKVYDGPRKLLIGIQPSHALKNKF